jgi:hypothetical protein
MLKTKVPSKLTIRPKRTRNLATQMADDKSTATNPTRQIPKREMNVAMERAVQKYVSSVSAGAASYLGTHPVVKRADRSEKD